MKALSNLVGYNSWSLVAGRLLHAFFSASPASLSVYQQQQQHKAIQVLDTIHVPYMSMIQELMTQTAGVPPS